MATQFSIHDNKPWKSRFFTIWVGQAISILGSHLVQFALIWHLTVTTGSATVLATASMAGTLPNVILGPFVGTLVDRWDRRRIMLLADSMIMLATLVLVALFALDAVATWHIYAVIQSTVEPDMQARIFTIMSSVGGGMAPIGLMIAGPVADRVGIQAWFFVGGIVCVLMGVTGLFIPAVMNIEEDRSEMPTQSEGAVPASS
jgi:MFS family permease